MDQPFIRFFITICWCSIFLFWGVDSAESSFWPFKGSSKAGSDWSCDKKADEAMLQGDYMTGITLHEQFLKKNPANGLAMYHLGFAYGQIEDHPNEILYYKKAIAQGLDEEGIFFNLGMACGELKQPDEAIRAFQQALIINPASANNHFGLAMIYFKKSSITLAIDQCLEAIQIDPEHLDARFLLGQIYLDSKNRSKALEQLHKILEIKPTHVEAMGMLKEIEDSTRLLEPRP